MAPTVREVLLFHGIDRRLFEKVITAGVSYGVARNVMALWIWLEMIGIDVILHLKDCMDFSIIRRFVGEAEAVLDTLRQDAPLPGNCNMALPLTGSIVADTLDLGFFYCHRDVAVRGVTSILDGVGTLIFDHGLSSLLRSYETSARAAKERGRRLPELPPELAKTYTAEVASTPEDGRSMFITFSKGHPLRKAEIVEYFTEKWGECVERVMMERTPAGAMPMYGRIVFTSESFIDLALNGEQLVKFVIKGKQMWARKYVTRRAGN